MKKYEFGGLEIDRSKVSRALFYEYNTYENPYSYKGTGHAMEKLGRQGWMMCGVYKDGTKLTYLFQREITE